MTRILVSIPKGVELLPIAVSSIFKEVHHLEQVGMVLSVTQLDLDTVQFVYYDGKHFRKVKPESVRKFIGSRHKIYYIEGERKA